VSPTEHIRDAVCRVARSLVGLSADPSSLRYSEYLNIVAPGETRQRQEELARASDCALVVAGIWRQVGIVSPLLEGLYHDGSAVSRVYEIARVSGALRSSYPDSKPQPGDTIWVGHGPTEHVYVCLEVNGDIILGVDGGQRDANGFEIVFMKEHKWVDLQEQSRVLEGSWGAPRSINGWWDITDIQTKSIYG